MCILRLTAALSLVLALSSGVAEADESTPMRVVVRTVGASNSQLLSRIEGQIADLAVTLVREPAGPLESTTHRRFERARSLTRQHGARVVVWFDRAGADGVHIYVAEPGRDTLFARRVAAVDPSARAEAVAIVVRSTLDALAQGGTIGVKVKPVPAKPAPPLPEPAATLAREFAYPRWTWNLGVQGQLSFDGESPLGQEGLMARVDATRQRWQLGLVGVVGVSNSLSDGMTTVHLTRHSAGMAAARRLIDRPRAALWVGLDAGLVIYTRSTTIESGSLTAAPPSTTVAALLAPLLRGQWRLLRHQRLWLTFELGAALVAGSPELRYELAGMPVVRNQLWPVQPRLGLGLRLEGL